MVVGIIDGRAREIILNVDKFFISERDTLNIFLKKLSLILSAQISNKDVIIEKDLLIKLTNELKNMTRVSHRVLAATGINKNTLTKIRKEGVEAKATNSQLSTPVKVPRGKKLHFDNPARPFQFKNYIHKQFIKEKEKFNIDRVLTIAKDNFKYHGSKSTLMRIITDMGFRLEKVPKAGKVLVNTGMVDEYMDIEVLEDDVLEEYDSLSSSDSEKLVVEYLESDEDSNKTDIKNTVDNKVEIVQLTNKVKEEQMSQQSSFEEVEKQPNCVVFDKPIPLKEKIKKNDEYVKKISRNIIEGSSLDVKEEDMTTPELKPC